MKIAIVIALCCAYAMAERCENNDECGSDSCCVPEMRFHILSKRDLALKPILSPWDMTGGRCVTYIKEGKSCHSPGFATCGCEPGTKCVYYPPEKPEISIAKPIEADLIKGKRMIRLRPGSSICESA